MASISFNRQSRLSRWISPTASFCCTFPRTYSRRSSAPWTDYQSSRQKPGRIGKAENRGAMRLLCRCDWRSQPDEGPARRSCNWRHQGEPPYDPSRPNLPLVCWPPSASGNESLKGLLSSTWRNNEHRNGRGCLIGYQQPNREASDWICHCLRGPGCGCTWICQIWRTFSNPCRLYCKRPESPPLPQCWLGPTRKRPRVSGSYFPRDFMIQNQFLACLDFWWLGTRFDKNVVLRNWHQALCFHSKVNWMSDFYCFIVVVVVFVCSSSRTRDLLLICFF